MKPPFGTLNATLAGTIAENAPKVRRIVEPFGDGGTYALHIGHAPPKEHLLNIVDPLLFAAMSFAQSATASERARLKSFDWVASPDSFAKVMAISAEDGPEGFYRWLYLKKFGMAMDPESPPELDILSIGKSIKHLIYGLPLMRAALKKVTLYNVDPFSLFSGGGSDTLWVLLPMMPEDVESARGRLSGLSGNVFFAGKVLDTQAVIDLGSSLSTMIVTPKKVASIMMGTFSVVTNFESKLKPIQDFVDAAAGMEMTE